MFTKKQLQNPDLQYRPDVRWWLAEGFHTDETLKKEIKDLFESGFGAVEFLAMEEMGADHALYGWGSEEWIHDSDTIVRETAKYGMGVSMTCGTNWSNANLIDITPDDRCASKELDYVVQTVPAGTTWSGPLQKPELTMPGVTRQDLVAVVAIRNLGEKEGKVYLDKDASFVLTDEVKDGVVTWTAPADGDYLLFFFWMHGTGQTAAPSKSVSYTINYIDDYGIEAFKKYWDEKVITESLQKNMDATGRAMMYMDSLELSTFAAGGQLWGYHFMEEFRKRRGYDLAPYLPFVIREAGMMQPVFVYDYHVEDEKWAERFYNDLYQTMTDCYCDNMMKPMQEWLHEHGMQLRSEISYGLPFEISQPGKYVDGIETESLEFASQIDSHRGLAGAAHIYDRIFSSETGATLLNYMEGLEFYTQIILSQFAVGVTRTVLHGYSATAGSESATYWPGHEGMWPVFSERFGHRQPAYVHYKDWTKMIARYQMLLRAGKPRMDLGILRLDYNYNNMLMMEGLMTGSEETYYAHHGMRANQGIYWQDMRLQNAGFTYDYFAPQLLEEDFVITDGKVLLPDGPGYQALLIYQEVLPIESAKKILSLAKAGLPVVLANGCTEQIRPGVSVTYGQAASKTPFHDGKDAELKEIIAELKTLPNVRVVDVQSETLEALASLGVTPRAAFSESNPDVLTCMRQDGEQILLYVYNLQYAEARQVPVTLRVQGAGAVTEIDCWNGTEAPAGSWKAANGITEINTILAPGQARMFRVDLSKGEGSRHMTQVETGTYELPVWTLAVEDWNEGDRVDIIEDRGLGIVTHEVDYMTKKTLLPAVKTELKPWKDIPKVGPEVSGVGTYTTTVTLPEGFGAEGEKAALTFAGTNGCSLAVYVNGEKAGAADFNARRVEIRPWLQPGDNTIRIEVSSTLNNRLLARGYYDRSAALSMQLADNANNANENMDADYETTEAVNPMASMGALILGNVRVRDYGLQGPVRVVTYREV